MVGPRSLAPLLLGLALAAAPRDPAPLALWVWEAESRRMALDPAWAARTCAALRSRGARILYLSPPSTEEGQAAQDRLVAWLHGQGFEVHALLADRDPAPVAARLARLLEAQGRAAPGARFDGLHFDVEPHALPGWTEAGREALAQAFLDAAEDWIARARAVDPRLRIGAALPFWFDGVSVGWRGRTRPLNEHLQDAFDYVALMAYRNHAEGRDGLIPLVEGELAYGDRIGRPVRVGLETAPATPDKLTFHGLGPGALAREMATARRRLRRHPSFEGFALHHLRTWLALAPPRKASSRRIPRP